jgi:hypothetical protein
MAHYLYWVGYRYIDQCQDMLNEPAYSASADVDVYESTIRTGRDPVGDIRDDSVEDAFAAYVDRGTVRFLEQPRKDLAATYERWLGASAGRQ